MTHCEVITKPDIGSDHRLVKKNDIEDKGKISKAENHSKKKKKSKTLSISSHKNSKA